MSCRRLLPLPNLEVRRSRLRFRPQHPNHVWAYDFMTDRTHDGKAFRLLRVLDEFTRECLAIVVARRLTADDVLATLTTLFVERGVPAHLGSDNGPGLCAKVVLGWLHWVGVQTLFIEPGAPGRTATSSPSTGSCGMSCWTMSSSSHYARRRS